jgi:hypothetical protein
VGGDVAYYNVGNVPSTAQWMKPNSHSNENMSSADSITRIEIPPIRLHCLVSSSLDMPLCSSRSLPLRQAVDRNFRAER